MVSEAIFMSASSTNALIDVMKTNTRELQMQADTNRIAAATGGSADVHVQMDHLIEFYNALSDLHDEVYKFSKKLGRQADDLGDMRAGGKVSGIVTAWNEMTAGAGARGAAASMAANLEAFDLAVMGFMHSLNASAEAYAERENIAIAGLDKAVGTSHAHKHGSKHDGKHGSKHETKPGKGQEVKGGAVLQGGGGQTLQGSEQVLQAPGNDTGSDTAAHGGLVLGG